MNITRENIDELNAVLKVNVTETDYAPKVEAALKLARKKATMPGFRPGMVPASLVKKMYGKSILVDEINKMLNEEIYRYIQDNKLDVLGQPLPKVDLQNEIDWDNQKDFVFSYEMGLAPSVELNFSATDKIDYLNIKVDAKAIDDAIERMRKHKGKIEYPETIENGDVVFVGLNELENGEVKEGGHHKTAVLSLEYIKNEELVSQLIGKKKQDTFVINPTKLAENSDELKVTFKEIIETEAYNGKDYKVTINNISRMAPADLNQELYDSIYGIGSVNGIEEFRARINEELTEAYKAETDKHFKHQVNHLITEKFKLNLPDEFLKRWIKAVNDKPLTDDQLSVEYPAYANNLRLQLVENKIITDNNISVTREEAEAYTYKLIADNFKRYGRDEDEAEIKETVKRVLSNEEEGKRIFQKLYDDKLVSFYLTKLGVTYKDLTVEEFNKEVEEHYKHHNH